MGAGEMRDEETAVAERSWYGLAPAPIPPVLLAGEGRQRRGHSVTLRKGWVEGKERRVV